MDKLGETSYNVSGTIMYNIRWKTIRGILKWIS